MTVEVTKKLSPQSPQLLSEVPVSSPDGLPSNSAQTSGTAADIFNNSVTAVNANLSGEVQPATKSPLLPSGPKLRVKIWLQEFIDFGSLLTIKSSPRGQISAELTGYSWGSNHIPVFQANN